jgi:alpha-glucosidase (family GH31 glycosyl hydrolase)
MNYTASLAILAGIVVLVLATGQQRHHFDLSGRVPEAKLDPAPYASWAHEHWVWLTSNQANQASNTELVLDYLARDIPVGGLNCDSLWSTGVNNFEWNAAKYPDPKGMISQMHNLGVHVILWATSMVNNDSGLYDYAKQHEYLLSDGELIKVWILLSIFGGTILMFVLLL